MKFSNILRLLTLVQLSTIITCQAYVDYKQLYYECSGPAVCNDNHSPKNCDIAINFFTQRDDSFNYTQEARDQDAVCYKDCWILVEGPPGAGCARNGNQLWWDYQDIRRKSPIRISYSETPGKGGGCRNCGFKEWDPKRGCITRITRWDGSCRNKV